MDPKQWLKNTFQEESPDIPDPKRVKFSDVQTALHKEFPSREFSPYAVSTLIRDNFPSTKSKPLGKSRQKHIVGFDWKTQPIQEECLLPTATESQIQQPGVSSASSNTANVTSISGLLIDIQQLKERINELESK